MKKSILWKIYFWCLSISVVMGIPGLLERKLNIRTVIDVPFTLLSFIGMFCYIYNKKIIKEKFWKLFLPLMVAWGGYGILITPFINAPKPVTLENSIELTIYYFCAIPLFLSLYFYGYRSSELWGHKI